MRQVAYAEPRPPVHGKRGDVLTVEQDPAVIGRDQTGDDIEAGRLAGAVRSEQADDLATVQRQRHAPEHRPLLEPLAAVRRTDALVSAHELLPGPPPQTRSAACQ